MAIEARKINVRGTDVIVHEVDRSRGYPSSATLECEGQIFSFALIDDSKLTRTRRPGKMISKAAYKSLLSVLNGIFGSNVRFDWADQKTKRSRR